MLYYVPFKKVRYTVNNTKTNMLYSFSSCAFLFYNITKYSFKGFYFTETCSDGKANCGQDCKCGDNCKCSKEG